MNEQSFELELQETFLIEAQEMLADTEAAFLKIESSPNDRAELDKIFRLIHTIKGSAHVAGFAELGQFAHVFETLLGALRENKISVSNRIVDVLLEANDNLKIFVESLRLDRTASLDSESIVAKISDCLPKSVSQSNSNHGSLAFDPSESANRNSEQSDKSRIGSEITPGQSKTTGSDTKQISSKPAATQGEPGEKIKTSNREAVFLVVDDESEILTYVSETLRIDGGFSVVVTQSADNALKLFRNQNFDAVFTDLKMPEMDGIQFVREIRRINEYIPIVFISGHSSREHFKAFLELGVDSFIEKPFTPEAILNAAQQCVRQSKLVSAILTLSRVSFRAFISLEKILASLPRNEAESTEETQLKSCMEEIRNATATLLSTERASRR